VPDHLGNAQARAYVPDARGSIVYGGCKESSVRTEHGLVDRLRGIGPAELPNETPRSGPDSYDSFVPAGDDSGPIRAEPGAVNLAFVLQYAKEETGLDGVHARETILTDNDDETAGRIKSPALGKPLPMNPNGAKELAVSSPPYTDDAVCGECQDEFGVIAK
jgi:hypothetical protein